LATELSPSVVNISSTRRVPYGEGVPLPETPDSSALKEMLKGLESSGDEGEDLVLEARSLGSGFIIDAEGLVVTNNHVIEGAEKILVALTDGTQLPATVVGADDKTDLAVLKVSAGRPLPVVQFADSDSAEIGDWVMAIGNPFGLGGSVSLGIVSARNRDIESGPYDSFIQTDAVINQGNSGGPLFDMNGKVIGINTAIYAQDGGALGVGFAVPVNLAKPVIDQLAEYGETRRGWLGVGVQEVTDDMAASLGRPTSAGAMVNGITPDGPADGVLADGDLILEFDGKVVTRMRDLPRIVAETAVDKPVPVKVLRRGDETTLQVTLRRPQTEEQQLADISGGVNGQSDAAETAGPLAGLKDLVGFDLEPLSNEKREEFGITAEIDGILVTEVVGGSDAQEKGFTPGVLVSEVNQKQVETVLDVTTLVGEAKEAGRPAVLFKIFDPAEGSRFVAVKLR